MLALMIVLLPLRGWTGDAMATQMASGMAAAATANTPSSHLHAPDAEAAAHHDMAMESPETMLSMHDCAGHAAVAEAVQDDATPASPCGSCEACQACHTIALFHEGSTTPLVQRAPGTSVSAATRFISADTALNQKPPIS